MVDHDGNVEDYTKWSDRLAVLLNTNRSLQTLRLSAYHRSSTPHHIGLEKLMSLPSHNDWPLTTLILENIRIQDTDILLDFLKHHSGSLKYVGIYYCFLEDLTWEILVQRLRDRGVQASKHFTLVMAEVKHVVGEIAYYDYILVEGLTEYLLHGGARPKVLTKSECVKLGKDRDQKRYKKNLDALNWNDEHPVSLPWYVNLWVSPRPTNEERDPAVDTA